MKCLKCHAYLPNNYRLSCPCGGKADICSNIGNEAGNVKIVCKDTTALQKAKYCNVYKRCIPNYRPTGEQLAEWLERPEAAMYHLCHGCKDYKNL